MQRLDHGPGAGRGRRARERAFARLSADVSSLSAQVGGTVDFSLDAGRAHAFRKYFLLGTISGSAPGFSLPGGTSLPLNWDDFTTFTLNLANSTVLVDTLGTLDAAGQAAAQVNTLGPLPPITVGVEMPFAFTLFAPFGFVSNAVGITIVD